MNKKLGHPPQIPDSGCRHLKATVGGSVQFRAQHGLVIVIILIMTILIVVIVTLVDQCIFPDLLKRPAVFSDDSVGKPGPNTLATIGCNIAKA